MVFLKKSKRLQKQKAEEIEEDEENEGIEGEKNAEENSQQQPTTTADNLPNGPLKTLTEIELLFKQLRDKILLENLSDIERESNDIRKEKHPILLKEFKLINNKKILLLKQAR